MIRFFGTCLLIAALCVGAVALLAGGIPGVDLWSLFSGKKQETSEIKDSGKSSASAKNDQPKTAYSEGAKADASTTLDLTNDDGKTVVVRQVDHKSGLQSLTLQDARVMATQRQDVPSERDGKMLFLATPAKRGEYVPPSKRLTFEVPVLAIQVDAREWKELKEEERLNDLIDGGNGLYRHVRSTDNLSTKKTIIVRQLMPFRKLEVGDRVEKDHMLGLINPALAIDEMFIKQANIEAAAAEIEASRALEVEYGRRYDSMLKSRSTVKGAVTEDDLYAAMATRDRYKYEAISKTAGRAKAGRELSGSLTTLKMHILRASLNGVIKTVYKQNGEAVKNLEPVLQIQSKDEVKVEAQVEIQDALELHARLKRAREWRAQAAELRNNKKTAEANRLEDAADGLLAVTVEASRVEPPRVALSGHHQPVTCVAVSTENDAKIVSGSEDQTVRLWARDPQSGRWQEKTQLYHHAAVRAVTCKKASNGKNLLLSGTATGWGRIFDLDAIEDTAAHVTLKTRHAGAILAVAFNADGSICATGGEDHAICLWDVSTGELLHKKKDAHKASVTTLTFTPTGQLASAGKDRRLVRWKVGNENVLSEMGSFDRRSGEVGQLSMDPDGKHVVFDEGRELRVLAVTEQSGKIEGSLSNPPGAAPFADFALYSPDGQMILTNGNATGRVQLWRAPSAKVRAAEIRNFVWSNANVTCGAFDPRGTFAVTGTADARVLVWNMPSKDEAEKPLPAQLSSVEEFLDTSLKRVSVRATILSTDPEKPAAPDWLIPGSAATIVVPPAPATR